MKSPQESLQEHHHELMPHVAFIRSAAEDVGHASTEALIEDIDEVIGFLTHALLPHAELEDRILYPAIERTIGGRDTMRTMSRDHAEVARLTDQLRRVRPRAYSANVDTATARELRRILYGLHTILSLHMAKEEEMLFPLLERLTAVEAKQLATAMAEVGIVPVPLLD